jgi:two-component system nitrogen regulation response regulator NtrX
VGGGGEQREGGIVSRKRALVVDDEAGIRETLAGILGDEGFDVTACASGEEGLERCRGEDFDVALLDVWLPGVDGLEVLAELRRLAAPPEVVMISGHGSVETAVKATKGGAFDFLEKPLSLEKTVLTVRHAVERRMLSERQRAERDAFLERNAIVGRSPAVRRLIEEIHRAAPTNGRVLVLGENGTGKELVARHVHFHSQRREQVFVEVNCAAIPDELIESELFGHVRGAFTGAVAAKRGRFALADRGTLFLDEIGDMSLRTQARVLRALQDQVFQPVGSTESVSVDVRVIAATNKDLEEEIRQGAFREDLYFRLNVVPFHVPPLRERREDIPLLLEHFLAGFCREHGREPKALGDSALDACVAYHWPGNERLVIMEPSELIRREHLPQAVRGEASEGLALARRYGSLKEAREAFERQYVLRTLREEGGNVTAAARALGLDRSSLYRRARALSIPLDDLRGGAD